MNKLSFEAGDIIYRENDTGKEMYVIASGKVESLREMGDDKIVLEVLGSQSFFGEMALFGDPVRRTTVRAVENTAVFVISKATVNLQFKKVPEWLVAIINTLAQRIIKTRKGINPKVRISLDYSIIKVLILMVSEFGTAKEKGKAINLTFVREEVCNILGITQDVLDTRLQKLNQFNLISVKGSSDELAIPDENRLIKYSHFLLIKSPEGGKYSHLLKPAEINAYERIHKVIKD